MNDTGILERRFPGRRASLKREILQQALICFNESGIEATTIDTIRARCDASVGAIYHHFGNREGILAALFFSALEDQQALFRHHIDQATTLETFVNALVISYVDWVAQNPEWARFQFQARSAVAKGPYRDELADRNASSAAALKDKLNSLDIRALNPELPFELLPSLIVGPAESYCRGWLAGRFKTEPARYRQMLADVAWRSVQIAPQA